MVSENSEVLTDSWLIRGARVADPTMGLWGLRDVLVVGGNVAEVAPELSAALVGKLGNGAVRVIEADGLWLWPGLVDLHVHFREPGYTHKETMASGCRAALRGGYTTVVCEPNTDPPITTGRLVGELSGRVTAESPVRVFFKAAMTEGRQGEAPADIESLARHQRVVALSDDGDPVVRPEVMEEVCRWAARVGLPLSPHCEDSHRSLAAYSAGTLPGFEPRPGHENEALYIERDVDLALRWGAPVHFSHVSLEESLRVLRRIREEAPSAPVTLECAPHHLLLSVEEFDPGAVPKVNPPLRPPSDRKSLQDALIDGEIDAIASDHAPHTAEEKEAGASGFIGLETTLALILTEFVHAGRLAPLDAAALMSTRPAEILGLPVGGLSRGKRADLTLIDPCAEWTVQAAEFASLSRNTPFEGRRLRGRAVGTMIDGRLEFARPSLCARIEDTQE
jgi:dihydroorotase